MLVAALLGIIAALIVLSVLNELSHRRTERALMDRILETAGSRSLSEPAASSTPAHQKREPERLRFRVLA